MLGYNAISRHSRLGSDFHDLGVTFSISAWFWSQFCHLGVTFGALWMHFSYQKTDWGAKGAPRGATPVSNSPIWVPFGDHFPYMFVFLTQKRVYLKHIVFFLDFLVVWSALGDGLICNPSTPAQSKHTFQCSQFFLKKVS